MTVRKRLVVFFIAVAMLFALTGCSSSTKRYRAVKTLSQENLYIGFRNDDQIAFYIMNALYELEAEGQTTAISQKWFYDDVVDFESDKDALPDDEDYGKRNIIFGVDVGAYPFAFKEDDKYGGFNVELAQAVCDKLGWTCTFISIDPSNAFVELSSGNIDVAIGMELDPKSEDYTAYGPFAENDMVIVNLSNSKRSMKGKSLVTDTSVSAKTIVEENERVCSKFAQIVRIQGGVKECFEKLDNGSADFILTTKYALDCYNLYGGNVDYSDASGEPQGSDEEIIIPVETTTDADDDERNSGDDSQNEVSDDDTETDTDDESEN